MSSDPLTKSQCDLILQHLQNKPITQLEALKLYKCFRLASRINDLKNQGYKIIAKMIKKNDKHFAEYRLG